MNTRFYLLIIITALLGALGTWYVLELATAAEGERLDLTLTPELKNDESTSPEETLSKEEEKETVTEEETIKSPPPKAQYVEVLDSCNHAHEGDCVVLRNQPNLEGAVVARLRTGVVLKVGETIETDSDTWYRIVYDEWLRYPERVGNNQFVAASVVHLITEPGTDRNTEGSASSPEAYEAATKKIEVSRGEQKLYAYENGAVKFTFDVSTGLNSTPTPRGYFQVYMKTPSRYMQGPIPGISTTYYDLPGVPWDLYFTEQGAVIHGAYWHNDFGKQHSNGCVNLRPEDAKQIYEWAELGTPVYVHD